MGYQIESMDFPNDQGSLAGKLLIAMPTTRDPRFAHSVVYVCEHNKDGAMGIVINKAFDAIEWDDLLGQLDIHQHPSITLPSIHTGGPVQRERGFVLHSPDYNTQHTKSVDEDVSFTTALDVVRDIAQGNGPRCVLFALGYAGWSEGQLDNEIIRNGWMIVESDEDLLFDEDLDGKWRRAVSKLGVPHPEMMIGIAGHA